MQQYGTIVQPEQVLNVTPFLGLSPHPPHKTISGGGFCCADDDDADDDVDDDEEEEEDEDMADDLIRLI